MRFVRALQMVKEQAERRAALYALGGVLNRQAVRTPEIILDRDLSHPAPASREPGTSAPSQKAWQCATLQDAHGKGYRASKSNMTKHPTCVKCGAYPRASSTAQRCVTTAGEAAASQWTLRKVGET